MADPSSGVSGNCGNSAAHDAANAQDTQAANETTEAQLADAAAAVNAAPTPAVTQVNPAPVDMTLSPSTLSQLSAMSVSAPTLDFSSVTSLGGIPSGLSYADVAAAAPTPAQPSIQEMNAFSPSFSITGFNTANIEATNLASISVNAGLAYNGMVDAGTFDASLQARMGLEPPSVTAAAHLGYKADVNTIGGLNAMSLDFTAGPFGTAAEPTYGLSGSVSTSLTDVDRFTASAAANFNSNGFTNGSATADFTHDFSETLSGTAKATVNFNADAVTSVIGEGQLNYKGINGATIGLTGRGTYDAVTGDTTGFFGGRASWKF
ncbi:hypothetical protein M2650_09190 [Luteimonas sp. SX5]|uniref:Transferrin-binding protein B C-lobe/N-lobe beta barrel domain-containing protein n=1 Tax=Luteimonas galliterrae TaxID=2940486 RepID=A0ABT0MIV2_9GAMM|nr:hypothetical protein [Luteimonas galliterrae]MCL1634803.1 hypothetical protein [Luteimonas galliterrae]